MKNYDDKNAFRSTFSMLDQSSNVMHIVQRNSHDVDNL